MCVTSSNFVPKLRRYTSNACWSFSPGRGRNGDVNSPADEASVLIVASELDNERPAGTDDSSEYADKMLEMDAAREVCGSSVGDGGKDGPRALVCDVVSGLKLPLPSCATDKISGNSVKASGALGAAASFSGRPPRLEKLLKDGRSGSRGNEDTVGNTVVEFAAAETLDGCAFNSRPDSLELEPVADTELATGRRRMAPLGTAWGRTDGGSTGNVVFDGGGGG